MLVFCSVMPVCKVRLREVVPDPLVLISRVAGSRELMLSNVMRPKTRVPLTVKLEIKPVPLRLLNTTLESDAFGSGPSGFQLLSVDQAALPPALPPSQNVVV